MSLIKKIDVEKHFADRRARRLGRMQPLNQPRAAGVKPAAKRQRVSASAEDVALGHSSPGVSSVSNLIRSDSDRNRLFRSPGSRQV